MLQDHELFDVDAVFEQGLSETHKFWSRIGTKPSFAGKKVLEVGSGLGFFTADIASQGAEEVLGLDIWEPRIEFSRRKAAERFPHLTNIRYEATPSNELPGENRFDIIVSQNTFEHVSDLDLVLASFRRLLKPGGRAYIGFSPLYNSPFGDHGELGAPVRLPWLHLIAGRDRVIAAFNKANNESVKTLAECGYNGFKPSQFMEAFERSGLAIEQIRVNQTEGRLKQAAMRGCTLLSKIPGLAPYLTIGMYLILRKD